MKKTLLLLTGFMLVVGYVFAQNTHTINLQNSWKAAHQRGDWSRQVVSKTGMSFSEISPYFQEEPETKKLKFETGKVLRNFEFTNSERLNLKDSQLWNSRTERFLLIDYLMGNFDSGNYLIFFNPDSRPDCLCYMSLDLSEDLPVLEYGYISWCDSGGGFSVLQTVSYDDVFIPEKL